MTGVEIATSVRDRELDDDVLTPFWSAVETLNVLVLIHPTGSMASDRLSRYFLTNIVGNPAEETTAAAHLIFGGVLGRQDRGFASKSDLTANRLTHAPSHFIRSFWYDTITHSTEALRFLVDRVGTDRVILGSDYPFPMGDPDPITTVTETGIRGDAADAILSGNALEALGT